MRTEEEIRADIIEQLAELEHEQWASWAKVLMNEGLTSERRERWSHTVDAPYMYLSEAEKEQDRVWARKAFAICAQVVRVLNDKGAEK